MTPNKYWRGCHFTIITNACRTTQTANVMRQKMEKTGPQRMASEKRCDRSQLNSQKWNYVV